MGYGAAAQATRGALVAGADASVSCESSTRVDAPPAAARRNRRSRRRSQRQSHPQQQLVVASPPAEGKTTIVVPSTGDGKAAEADGRPVNRTAVRRRPKPSNNHSTVTKVVTDVSLEALRARRHGTAAETPTGDVHTIEEVSRILRMYAASHGGGRPHFAVRPCARGAFGSWPTNNNNNHSNSSMHSNLHSNAAAGGVENGEGDVSSLLGGDVRHTQQRMMEEHHLTARAVHAHVMSLVQSGRLPADSLDVLHAMLSHSRAGGQLTGVDTRSNHNNNSMLTRHGTAAAAVADASAADDAAVDPLDVSPTRLQQSYFEQPQLLLQQEHHAEDTMHEAEQQQQSVAVGTSQESVLVNRFSPTDCFLSHAFSALVGGAVASAVADDDDDADVVAMLRGIREMAQPLVSPRRFGPNSGKNYYEGEYPVNNVFGGDGAMESATAPATNVSISPAEREQLRELQEAFRARMQISGSPAWTTPRRLTCNADGLLDADDETAQRRSALCAASEERELDSSRWATNRTLFSYHTATTAASPADAIDKLAAASQPAEIPCSQLAYPHDEEQREASAYFTMEEDNVTDSNMFVDSNNYNTRGDYYDDNNNNNNSNNDADATPWLRRFGKADADISHYNGGAAPQSLTPLRETPISKQEQHHMRMMMTHGTLSSAHYQQQMQQPPTLKKQLHGNSTPQRYTAIATNASSASSSSSFLAAAVSGGNYVNSTPPTVSKSSFLLNSKAKPFMPPPPRGVGTATTTFFA